MVWLVDDLAEAALGPWGLAVALGVGVIAAARRRGAPVTSDGPPADVNGSSLAWASGGLSGGALALAGGVKERIQATLAGAGDSWRDLYAEAHHEWEQSRAGTTTAVGAAAAAPTTIVAADPGPARPGGKRVRGPNGRYLREQA